MSYLPSATSSETIHVDRDALHAFVDAQADLIERTPVPDDVLSPEDLFPAALDPERLWRIAGVATLIGLAIYEDAERFIAPAAEPEAVIARLRTASGAPRRCTALRYLGTSAPT